MMKPLRRAAAAFLATVAFALPAGATSYSPDYTDLWYNDAESGWGVNLIQQHDVIFATLFVYGTGSASGNPAQWFTASALRPSPAGSQTSFTGQLVQSTGPWFGATSFDPNAVTRNVVGTMTLTFDSVGTGTLQYTVNGASVTKRIKRQTWTANQLAGNYLGGLTATGSNCTQVSNGPILIFQTLNVQQSGLQVAMNVQFTSNQGQASQCTFSGTYDQTGRLGSVTGSWSCTINGQAGNAGSFTMSSIEPTQNGFTGKFHGNDQYCTYDGQFGGVRDVPLS